jgi:mono/diheme cytochrome c family protein
MKVSVFVSLAALLGAALSAESAMAQTKGATLFANNCAACHQPRGQGVKGAFPALARNKFVQGDAKNPAYVVTHGRGGMPNFSADLNDADVAAVLTYVRSSWGNKAPPITPAIVASVRGAKTPPDPSAMLPYH